MPFTIEISEKGYLYLEKFASGFGDTASQAFDRMVDSHNMLEGKSVYVEKAKSETPSFELEFGQENMPNVSHTNIASATINGNNTKRYWNDILSDMLELAAKSGSSVFKLKELLNIQIDTNSRTNTGYRIVKDAGFSFQGVDANRACKSIARLAQFSDAKVELQIEWQNKPNAQFAGQKGIMRFP